MNSIAGTNFVLRPWQKGDEDALTLHANNPAVSGNLTDLFPSPYTPEDAAWWIREGHRGECVSFAIVVDGEACGGIGCRRKSDICRYSAELGYWLGEAYWGRGIASEAVSLTVPYIFEHTDLIRLEADVFDYNSASARVLEKCGFTCEGTRRAAAVKNGKFLDLLHFARVRENLPETLAIAPEPSDN